MKNPLRFLALAAFVVLPFVGRAQTTYDNLGSVLGNVSPSFSAIQTFTGFTNISSITWTVTNVGGSPATATFDSYIVAWNGSATADIGSLQPFQVGVSTGITPIGAGASTDLVFNAALPPLDSSLTYAVVLSYASGGTFAATTGINPGGAFFGSGGAGAANFTVGSAGGVGNFQNALETLGTSLGGTAINGGQAYAMSVDGTLAPVPEPKTAAAGIAALFVAALVGRRMILRRKLAVAPLAA